MLTVITGRSQREEASAETKTFDLVRWIRARRLQWVGHILRMRDDRLVKDAVRLMYNSTQEGDLLMDVPATDTWRELCKRAENRDSWSQRVWGIRSPRVFKVSGKQFVQAVDVKFTISS